MEIEFPSTWRLLPLEECMDAIIDYRGKTPEKSGIGIPLLSAKVIKGGRILEESFEYLPTENFDFWMRRGLPQTGDIVMTTEGPLGEIAQLDSRKYALGQRLITLRGKRGLLDNTYLKFQMQSAYVQDQLYARATGTTVLGIKQRELRQITLPIPPLTEQRAIAHILGSLDDKIELNRRMNATLEAMARAIFQSWFVDFDPVHAKARGEQPYGLDADTAALFPGSFEKSELGPIPAGWEVEPLSEAIEINPNRTLRKGQVAPYLSMDKMPTFSARPTDWEYREFGSGMKFINGDVLLARITPCLENGKTAYVDFLEEGQVAWGSTEYIVFHSKSNLPPEYPYFLARSEELRAFAIQNMTGTSGRQRVPASAFEHFPIVVPPEKIAFKFGDIAHLFLLQIKANDEQSRTLAALRDILLPKLISGELRVGDLEDATAS